ncbi:MAG: crossover junction endodeoxyribonuclease RuvC [Mariprofundaceae bacterium]
MKGCVRVLGVDPGSRRTGVGIIECCGSRLRHVHHDVIRCDRGDLAERMYRLFHELGSIIKAHAPVSAGMEDVFVSRNAASALKLGQARGALLAACAQAGLSVTPYPPTLVKQAVVGFGRADKTQVQHMVRTILHPPEPLPEDAADALAVAICHAHHIPMQALSDRKRTMEPDP